MMMYYEIREKIVKLMIFLQKFKNPITEDDVIYCIDFYLRFFVNEPTTDKNKEFLTKYILTDIKKSCIIKKK